MGAIDDAVAKLGVLPEAVRPYGRDMAKIDYRVLRTPRARDGEARLVLVSAITPTPAGEGKTTTTIGLGDGLARIGKSVCVALREPSLGPCLGFKGVGTGGGRAQVSPADRINLHFTGDFHAITSAHNLLAAAIDNHMHQGNELGIEARRVVWPRVLDMNDRALRDVVIGLGGTPHGVPRETSFDITAASELMAMLCLADSFDDLRARIERTVVAYRPDGSPVLAGELRVTGAMLALLRDALHPNLVTTLEGTPALIHGGPFANIAHGCNSVLATRVAMHCADWVVTEAGFGFDLGAEKFFDIKCRSAGLNPAAVVLVATVRALKMHGGLAVSALNEPNPAAVRHGLPNLAKHVENIHCFGKQPIVALNQFGADTEDEIAIVREFCDGLGVPFAASDHFTRGGEGAVELARAVVEHADPSRPFHPLYPLEMSVPDKITTVAQEIYGADDVAFTKAAQGDLKRIENLGYAELPVCIAKTQSSLSDDPKLRGRPRDFQVTVRNLKINAGAGFLVVLTGEILRMPGLPARPRAEHIELDDHDEIVGLL